MGHRDFRRWSLVHPQEVFDAVTLIVIGAALMAGKVRGVDSTLPGNVIASLLLIAVGGLLIGGRVAWPESERKVMWAWIALLALAVLVYMATNFL
jgi:hypothetical protein